jgi:hypothetical protein
LKLRKSLLWVPAYEQVEMIKKMKAEEIARKLKRNGVDREVIIQATGLTKEEIEKL